MNLSMKLKNQTLPRLLTYQVFDGFLTLKDAIRAGNQLKLKNNFAIVEFLGYFFVVVYDTTYNVTVIGKHQVWNKVRKTNQWEAYHLQLMKSSDFSIKQLTRSTSDKNGIYTRMTGLDSNIQVYLHRDGKWEKTKHFKYVQTYIQILGESLLACYNFEVDLKNDEHFYLKNSYKIA